MAIVGAIGFFNGLHSGMVIRNRRLGEHGITSDIEMVDMKDINEAWDRVVKADVKYRFVIDTATL